jgi:tetratricopeptide (TPR) repeat protein
VGLAIALAWAAADLAGRARGARVALGAAGAAAVTALALTAHAQVAHWHDTLALFRHAATVTEGNYFAHFGIANGLRREGRLGDAVVEYRRALELRPHWSRAANNLAWVLATAPDPSLRDPAAAIRLAEPLARRDPPDPNHLDTLAAAYAAGGRFDAAVRAAERAARAADGAGLPAVARAARANLARYRAGQRVVDPGSPGARAAPAPGTAP